MQIRPDGGQISPLSVYRKQTERAQQQEKPSAGGTSAEAGGGDRVSLSDDARLMSEAARVAQDTADVRQERVEELKAKVQSGTYHVDSRSVAEAMLRQDMEIFG